jgi:hypothetical protein
MSPSVARTDLPPLREFLDSLPAKPCPSKLPEEYCKMCKRLNGQVYDYCTKQVKPQTMDKPTLEDILGPEEPLGEPEIPAHKKTPILEKPKYEEGETPIEFAPSKKSIEEAKKSLPKFIPVKKGPRTFRALDEPAEEEFASFDIESPSLFRSPASLGMSEEDMMFTLVSHEGAIEVAPLEISGDNAVITETVYEGSDGVVEAVEIPEGEIQDIEVEPPVFEFVDEGEIEEGEVSIVGGDTDAEKQTPEGYEFGDSMEEAERLISELADEITGITERMDISHEEEGIAPFGIAEEAKPKPAVKKAKRKVKVKRKGTAKRKVKVKRRKPVTPKETVEEKPQAFAGAPESEEEEPLPSLVEEALPSEEMEKELKTEEEIEPKPMFQPEPVEETPAEPEAEAEEAAAEEYEEPEPAFQPEPAEEIQAEPELEEEKVEEKEAELPSMLMPEPTDEGKPEAEIEEGAAEIEEEPKPIFEPEPTLETEAEDGMPSAEDIRFKIRDEMEKLEETGDTAPRQKLKKVKVKKKKKMKMKKLKVKKAKEETGEE